LVRRIRTTTKKTKKKMKNTKKEKEKMMIRMTVTNKMKKIGTRRET